MKIRIFHNRAFLRLSTAALVFSLSACNSIGPSSLVSGRGEYTEAIAITNDRQILSYIVAMRYTQSTTLLTVSSITANFNVIAKTSAQFGVGPEKNYLGNIVPLAAGIAYEENPTISYTPVQGEKYIRQLLSPIPLDLTVLLSRGARSIGETLTVLVRSINGMRNPDFLTNPSPQANSDFIRVTELFDELWDAGSLELVQSDDDPVQFSLALFDYVPNLEEQVMELSSLLGLPKPKNPGADLAITLHSSIEGRGLDGIALQIRSVNDLMLIAAASIDVPEDDKNKGVADAYPPLGPVGDHIRIHHSKEKPENASVAVKYRDWWFYIDETDQSSKRYFQLVEMLTGASIADAGHSKRLAPLLTIPVSR